MTCVAAPPDHHRRRDRGRIDIAAMGKRTQTASRATGDEKKHTFHDALRSSSNTRFVQVRSLTVLLRSNRIPAAIGVAVLVVGSAAFQYVLGLSASVAVVLFFLIVGTALGIYRLVNQSSVEWDQP